MKQRFSLTSEQKVSLKKAFIKYIIPLLLVFLVAVQQGKDFNTALYLVYGAGLQLAINFLTKFVPEQK